MNNITEMLKGVLEGCVLEVISKEEIYGYEITKRLNDLGISDIAAGTVYTILVRLEKNKMLNSRKIPSEVGPHRKVYKLSSLGEKELLKFWEKWEFMSIKLKELKEIK